MPTSDFASRLTQTFAIYRFTASEGRCFQLELMVRIWKNDLDTEPDLLKHRAVVVVLAERMN